MTAKLDENTVPRSAVEALLQAAILIAARESFAKIGAGAYLRRKVLEGCLRAVGLGSRADAADGAVVAAAGSGLLVTLGGILSSPSALATGRLSASTTPTNASENEIARKLAMCAEEGEKNGAAPRSANIGTVTAGPLALGGSGARNTELKGAADINLRVEVTADANTIARRAEQSISANGALRSNTGVSIPEAPTGAMDR